MKQAIIAIEDRRFYTNAGIWALTQPGYRLASLAASLAHWCEPWVAAAASEMLP